MTYLRTYALTIAAVICGVGIGLLIWFSMQPKQLQLRGINELGPSIQRMSSSTVFLVPEDNTTQIALDNSDLLFGTNTARTYLRLQATSTQVQVLVMLSDLPCTISNRSKASAVIGGAVLTGSGSTSQTFIIDSDSLYTGPVRVCSISGTTSIGAVQGGY